MRKLYGRPMLESMWCSLRSCSRSSTNLELTLSMTLLHFRFHSRKLSSQLNILRRYTRLIRFGTIFWSFDQLKALHQKLLHTLGIFPSFKLSCAIPISRRVFAWDVCCCNSGICSKRHMTHFYQYGDNELISFLKVYIQTKLQKFLFILSETRFCFGV